MGHSARTSQGSSRGPPSPVRSLLGGFKCFIELVVWIFLVFVFKIEIEAIFNVLSLVWSGVSIIRIC